MTERYGDKYRVHEWVKFNYSEIGEYIDENHTDKPLRNDEIIDLLNEKDAEIKRLKNELVRYKVQFNSLQDKYGDYLKIVHGCE